MRVLVTESIGDAGIALLRERLDVDVMLDATAEQVAERVEGYEALVVRSATQVTAALIERATRLRVIGRAGVGVDNVDVAAATQRGIVVVNAPESNVVTAAEHTMALLLALARNLPQAHASLTAGRWERGRLSGVELLGKTLGVLGFGRIGQLVAQRAHGFGMRVLAYDPFVGVERFRELGVDRAEQIDDVLAQADVLTLHLPETPQTSGLIDAAALARCKDGVRILNVARGGLVVDDDLRAALDSGKVAGAALDVFRREPITEHPLFGYPNVIVTPHLGASTAEATERAGLHVAEQVTAALTGGVVAHGVNIPVVAAEDMEALGPFLPLCRQLGRLATALSESASVDRVEIELLGRLAEHDTRPLSLSVLLGVLDGRTEERVNLVNAPALAAQRGIEVTETKSAQSRDFTDLVRVTIAGGAHRTRVAGTAIGRTHRPHLLEAWGHRFNLQLEPHLALFRYRDVPGMVGRVGTALGSHGINISSAAVGHVVTADDGEPEADDGFAVMVVTADQPVPQAIVDEIASADGFVAGRSVTLA